MTSWFGHHGIPFGLCAEHPTPPGPWLCALLCAPDGWLGTTLSGCSVASVGDSCGSWTLGASSSGMREVSAAMILLSSALAARSAFR
jgi:hypothetical protein